MPDLNIDWMDIARGVLRSRLLDSLETSQLAPQGKVKYQFSAGGHELSQVLLATALTHPHDGATVYYRSRPFVLACGLTLVEALAAGMARQNSPSQGRDAGVMFNLPRRKGPTVLPTSGNVGAQYTPAAGWAQAIRYRQRVLGETEWEGALAVAIGGDGSVAANGFWAALNIATPLKLPMMFYIEDNAYGISVPATIQTPNGNIAANLACYGNLQTYQADGSDPEDAWGTIQQAVKYVRSGTGPCLVRMCVPRLAGHTFIDTQAYKSPELRAEESACDPLLHLRAFLEKKGLLSSRGWEALEAEIHAEINDALAQVEGFPDPDPGQASRHMYFEGAAPLQGGLRPEGVLPALGSELSWPSGPRINLIDAVRRTLEIEMEINPRLAVFGEDVGVKGGVHGATIDMQNHFGAERVFDTSLSEDGIMGRSAGMAMAGLLPAPEIQFRKYADPAHEQISDLGTVRWRTANTFAAPVVLRIPVGYAKKTGDPWHSVSGEAVYAHTPGWRIAYPSNAEDAVGLLRTALRGDDPTLFLEHRALLDTPEGRRAYPGDDFCLPFGRAAALLQGNALTVVTWGAMTPRCLDAAQPFSGQVHLLDLRTVVPWDRTAVFESVQKTGKLLIVHEDGLTVGFGAEISAQVASECFTFLDAPIERMAPPDVPIPYNVPMMHQVIPSTESIRAKMNALLRY